MFLNVTRCSLDKTQQLCPLNSFKSEDLDLFPMTWRLLATYYIVLLLQVLSLSAFSILFSLHSCDYDELFVFQSFTCSTLPWSFWDLPSADSIQTNLLGWIHTTKCSDVYHSKWIHRPIFLVIQLNSNPCIDRIKMFLMKSYKPE
jgi:hypothetical protein